MYYVMSLMTKFVIIWIFTWFLEQVNANLLEITNRTKVNHSVWYDVMSKLR